MCVGGASSISFSTIPDIREPKASRMQMTAVAALFWQTMAMQVKTEERAAERSSTVSIVSMTISPGTQKAPISGIPTQR